MSMPDFAATYRTHAPSTLPKCAMAAIHLLALIAAAWMLFGGGIERLSTSIGWRITFASDARRALLLGAGIIYFLRLLITTFIFFRRRVTWGEAIGVGAWVAMLQLLYAFFGGRQTATIGALAIIGIGLYLIGSFLNTFSEYQRHVFKRPPANKGKLYTAGLFHYAMHINYFGDVVLFTGWALLAQNEWLLILPLLMLLGFVLVNIPVLDRHLAEHYGDDFRAYAACTSKLVPFIY